MDILLRARAGSQALPPGRRFGGNYPGVKASLQSSAANTLLMSQTRSTAGMFKTCIAEFSVSQTKGLDREFSEYKFGALGDLIIHLSPLRSPPSTTPLWPSISPLSDAEVLGAQAESAVFDIPRTWRHARTHTSASEEDCSYIRAGRAHTVSEQEGGEGARGGGREPDDASEWEDASESEADNTVSADVRPEGATHGYCCHSD
ncbi:hypothetical protein B0H17DRAFT_1133226 [Mycena rosella]|uniref:Uncharacterized protein n=1 Tax=Mycena rosella TaxID=1033263 RepID=A0AAD7GF91_MYCRO|nr:hypothetical protein B0H17DRAFT_1133226 [Mycena rosella]